MSERVTIHYRRLPDREDRFEQRVLCRTPGFVVTLLERTPREMPMRIGGRTVLEAGSPVVWFTYPGRWHDIGRFHLADGRFTGYYANVLTPVRMRAGIWETTDLALDVWRGADGHVEILDRDEFDDAVARGWLTPERADRALAEAEALAAAARSGDWPPPEVDRWTLTRALEQSNPDRVPGSSPSLRSE